MKFSLSLLLAITFTMAQAQQYFYKTVDFADSAGRASIHQIEPLGAILLKGYLDGQLKAYRFGIKSEDVKWKPLEPQDMPDAWDPAVQYYYTEDRVTYKGKFYECVWDCPAKLEYAPPRPEHWKEYKILGDPVSTIHSWATAKDTTSKAALLESLVEYEESLLDAQWSGEERDSYYSTGELLVYKGKYYECQIDHHPYQRRPDVDLDYWIPTKPRVKFHLPWDEINFAGVYYWNDSITGRMVPQMLSVEYPGYNKFSPGNIGFTFFHSDVVGYLASLKQLPLLYHNNLGYLGTPQLMHNRYNIFRMLMLMQKNMNGELKPSKKNIVDAAKYERFLQASMPQLQTGNWSMIQDLVTNDVLVTFLETGRNGFYYNTPVVKISWMAMEKVLVKELAPIGPPRQWNYLEWIDDYTSSYKRPPEPVDTLEVKVRQPLAIPVPMRVSFLEDRLALAKDNAVMSPEAIHSLWTALKRAVDTNQINLTTKETRLFPVDKPFPEVTFKTSAAEWTLEKGFQLESEPEVVLDSAALINSPTGFRVVYRRQVTSQKSTTPLFEPVKLAVVMFDSNNVRFVDSYFLWEDVVKVGGTTGFSGELLNAIRDGSLRFDSAEVSYGLVGEK